MHTCPEKYLYESEQCLLHPLNFSAYFLMITIGYMIYDFIACILFLHENTTIMWQTYFHHIVGIIGFSCVVLAGGFVLTIGSASLFIEISNTFLSFNYYLKYHGHENHIIYKLNGIVFLLSFFCVRVIYFGYCVYRGILLFLAEDL